MASHNACYFDIGFVHKSPIVSIHFLNEWGDQKVVPYRPQISSRERTLKAWELCICFYTSTLTLSLVHTLECFQRSSESHKLHYAIITDEKRIQVSRCIFSSLYLAVQVAIQLLQILLCLKFWVSSFLCSHSASQGLYLQARSLLTSRIMLFSWVNTSPAMVSGESFRNVHAVSSIPHK